LRSSKSIPLSCMLTRLVGLYHRDKKQSKANMNAPLSFS
jgi:hypothetical protein